MPESTEWDSFYVIIASAAGALIGLQFVVMTLIAEKPPKDAERASAAFATPPIVHFSASLLVSALMRAPWPAIVFPAVLLGLIGVGGLVYCAIVARRMKKQFAYQPGFEDWLFHVVLPLVSYAILASAAFAAHVHTQGALFAVAVERLLHISPNEVHDEGSLATYLAVV
ncbi:MAG: hypothetical protein ACLPIG_20030 [Methylocella sp.]